MERNKRILIVDDQQDLREQLAKLLRRSGKKNETTSFVQQMRDRLSGSKKEESKGDDLGDTYTVNTAAQGEDAFEMVKKANQENEPYAVLFTDMRMPPGWDGLETAKKIREIDKNIEIVIMTAYADHDQTTIAESIGTPEKLLYIKKPFQSEEIYQLALSLTSKWNFEETERMRKEWLEILIRSMSKVKTVTSGKVGDLYSTILKSVLNFTSATKGFITVWDESGSRWKVENFIGVDEAEVKKCIEENSKRFYESRTTQNFDGKYLLPLKREGYSAVVVIYDVVTQSDPEWYKLLSLLIMTAGEVLSNSTLSEIHLKKQQISALGIAVNKISTETEKHLSKLLETASQLKNKIGTGENLSLVESVIENGSKLRKQMADILVFGKDISIAEFSDTDIVKTIRETCVSVVEKHGKSAGVKFDISGLAEAKINASAGFLGVAFSNLCLNSIEAARNANKSSLNIKVNVKDDENDKILIIFEDDGPGIPAVVKNSIFEPFVTSKDLGFGLGLTIARQIIESHKGNIYCDTAFTGGSSFVIKLPKPQA